VLFSSIQLLLNKAFFPQFSFVIKYTTSRKCHPHIEIHSLPRNHNYNQSHRCMVQYTRQMILNICEDWDCLVSLPPHENVKH